MMREKRENRRVKFYIDILFYVKNNEPIKGEVRNISLRGANVIPQKMSDFKVGDSYRFLITLADSRPDLKLEGDAKIVRFGKNNDIGIHFVAIEADTLGHLRHIVALNFGDGDLIDDELKVF